MEPEGFSGYETRDGIDYCHGNKVVFDDNGVFQCPTCSVFTVKGWSVDWPPPWGKKPPIVVKDNNKKERK